MAEWFKAADFKSVVLASKTNAVGSNPTALARILRRSVLAKFSKNNFKLIIHEIEDMEAADQNIWVPIGILEYMFDDYMGYIDNYFHQNKEKRDIDQLWSYLNRITVN